MNNGITYGPLNYLPNQEFSHIGNIYFDENFENINIWATNQWRGLDGNEALFIVTATSYEQAIDVQNKMREKFGINRLFVPHEE